MTLLDTENADRDLTDTVQVLSHVMAATTKARAVIVLGDGSKDLDGDGGEFELTLSIGGVVYDGGVQTKEVAAGAARARFESIEFVAKAGQTVSLSVKSPNAGDDDVDCTAELWAVADPSLTEIREAITADHGTGSYVRPAGVLSGTSIPSFESIKFVYGDLSLKTIEVLDSNGDAVELPDPDVEVLTLAIETYDHQDVYIRSTDDAEDPIEIDPDEGTITLTPNEALVFLEHDTQLTISLRGANNREIARGAGYIAYSALNNAEEPD